MRRPHLALIFLSIGTLAGLSLKPSVTATSPISEEDELLRNATLVFSRAVDTPAAAIPAAVLIRASGIAVIPAATGQGNRYHGKGVLSARGARPDDWTPPAVIDFEGAIPFDLEAGPIDVVLVAQTRRGLDSLVQERSSREIARPTAPGALGHSSPAGINADVLAYMQFAQLLRRRHGHRLGRPGSEGVQRDSVRPAILDRRHRSRRGVLSPAPRRTDVARCHRGLLPRDELSHDYVCQSSDRRGVIEAGSV